ncbi:MAG: PhzF family phenazine biosynthesis protein [Actinobacteria bacterium]|nr:PhzF family phenazine biosynthesis protein [Actinomycetota bacterium]
MRDVLVRLAAFSADGRGGNPAGVWLGAELPTAEEMQRIAAEVGYSRRRSTNGSTTARG